MMGQYTQLSQSKALTAAAPAEAKDLDNAYTIKHHGQHEQALH
jgi:hypothetical protein